MKIQYLNGGLANQTFQYIFARYYDLSHPDEPPMILDDSFFFIYTEHNGYELEKVFSLHPNLLSQYFDSDVWEYMIEEKKQGKSIPQILLENGTSIRMVTDSPEYMNHNPFFGPVATVTSNLYTPNVLDVEGDVYYNGYWINQSWFQKYASVFYSELSFPPFTEAHNILYSQKIRATNSLAVHIRRKDFVTLHFAWPVVNYYQCLKSLSNVLDSGCLFVFSDDIDWCKEHAEELGICFFQDVTYVTGNHDHGLNYRDLQLMSQCKNLIHTPSSFGYLSILLNPSHHLFELIIGNAAYYINKVY